MDYQAPNGKNQPALFGNELVLYYLILNMRSIESRPQIEELKTFLSNAGIMISELARNPEQAAEMFRALADGRKVEFESLSAESLKKYRMLIASGFDPREADQWMQFDQVGKDAFKKISAKWYKRDGNIPTLTNATTKAVTGKTASELKALWNVNETPRNFMSTMEKAALGWLETVAGILHDTHDSKGTNELLDDIDSVSGVIDMDKLNKLKDVRVKRPLPKPKQPKLLKGGDDE